LEFELRATAVEVCEQFVGTNWGVEVALWWEKYGFTEELMTVVTLHFVCDDILGRADMSNMGRGGNVRWFLWDY
jgi:hypothetical protein